MVKKDSRYKEIFNNLSKKDGNTLYFLLSPYLDAIIMIYCLSSISHETKEHIQNEYYIQLVLLWNITRGKNQNEILNSPTHTLRLR